MLSTAGLSLDQAPPISIPFRFFLTAPLFGLIAGAVMLFYGDLLFVSRWGPMTLALTHLFTLGFLGMVMCGALLQLLPVVAGSPVPGVIWIGRISHLLLTLGTLTLVGFFFIHDRNLMLGALVMLAGALLPLIGAVGLALKRVRVGSPTVLGMRLALLSLLVAVLLAVPMGLRYSGWLKTSEMVELIDIHLSWGLIGWVGLLLIGVSYQVVPMFQVTPEYPGVVRRWLAPGLFSGLFGWTLLVLGGYLFGWPAVWADRLMDLLAFGLPLFALVTLGLQRRRKRRLSDATLRFWRSGLTLLVATLPIWLAGRWFDGLAAWPRYPVLIGVLVLFGVAYPLVNGMLYKIVPFLSWFHLQNRQLKLMCMTVTIPHMKELLPDRPALRQFRLYQAAMICTLLAVVWSGELVRLAGLLLLLCNLLLFRNLFQVMRRYRVIARQLEKCGG